MRNQFGAIARAIGFVNCPLLAFGTVSIGCLFRLTFDSRIEGSLKTAVEVGRIGRVGVPLLDFPIEQVNTIKIRWTLSFLIFYTNIAVQQAVICCLTE